MNPRILEIAEQSGFKVNWQHPDVQAIKMARFEEFTKLIVRECLGDFKDRIATRYRGSDKDRDIAYGMEIVYFDIIDKFGVEE